MSASASSLTLGSSRFTDGSAASASSTGGELPFGAAFAWDWGAAREGESRRFLLTLRSSAR